MLFLPVKPSWLLLGIAQRIYLACALLTFALIATLIGVQLAIRAAGFSALTVSARPLVKILLFPEILGSALLWVAMWYFWFGFDRAHYLKKAISFLLLFFLVPFGTLFYYFVTYRRRVASLELPH